MHSAAASGRHGVEQARLDSFFRPYGLAGTPLAAPVAALLAATLVLVFCLEVATPGDVLMFFGFAPFLAAMWLLPRPYAALVALVGAAVFVGASITEGEARATEISVCIVALGMAAATRWYAGELDRIIRRGSLPSWPPPRQNGVVADGLGLLTRRELEIARLASGGYTSREIAALLHISERTVENHIGNVYGKLGINSRRELIKRAAGFTRR